MKRIVVGSLVILMFVMSLTLWWTQQGLAAGSCGALKGRLAIKQEHQLPDKWCWVATTSEILKWFKFKHANQCHIYDVTKGTEVCKEIKKENGGTAWVNKYNDAGEAEDAANAYNASRGSSLITVTKKSVPMSYADVVEQICPSDGTLGSPFIWTFWNKPDEPLEGTHDVVVMGYSNLSNEGGTKTYGNWLRVHNPQSPTMELYLHDWYEGELYHHDLMIAKNVNE